MGELEVGAQGELEVGTVERMEMGGGGGWTW